MQSVPKHIPKLVLLAIVGCACATGRLTAADEPPVVLSPFEVHDVSENAYSPSATNTGTIIAMPRDQIPFVTSVVTSKMIEDLHLLNPSDFASQIAGVSMASGDQLNAGPAQLGTGTHYKVRGTDTVPLYNGFQTGAGLIQSPFAIDRVEVTKGPNSILYGQSTAGGTINFVPKQATIGAEARTASLGAGTDDEATGSFDIGGDVGGEGRSAVRFGGGYQKHTRQQQFYRTSQADFYGAYRLYLTKNISLEVNAESLRTKTTPARTEAFVSAGSGTARVTDPYNRLRNNRNFNYNGPWSKREGTTWISSGYLTDVISPNLTARIGGFYARQSQNLSAPDGLFALANAVSATGYYQNQDFNQSMTGLKVDLLHQTILWGAKINSLLGYEDHLGQDSFQQLRTATNYTVSIPFARAPVASDWPQPPDPSLFNVWAAGSKNRLYWSNYRFTQIVTSPNDALTAMWGIARGQGTSKTTDLILNAASKAVGSGTTFTVGPTYRLYDGPRASVTLFANYSTSFVIQEGNKQDPSKFNGFPTVAALRDYVSTVTPQAIDPQTGKGYEAGVRTASRDGKLRVELTWFDQSRDNIARNFFVRESNVAGVTSELVIATYQLASGKEEDKGAELSFDWSPSKELAFYASGLLSRGRVVSNPEAPDEVGFELPQSPEKMINVWGRYKLDRGPLSGFVLGAGASYRSSTRTLPTLADRFRRSDAYTLARVLVAYEFGRGKHKQSISLNIENALDQTYTSESAILSEPRTYHLIYSCSW